MSWQLNCRPGQTDQGKALTLGAFTLGDAMKFTMEIYRLHDKRYRVVAFDAEGMRLQWVSPRYRWLWVARWQGRKDLTAYVRKAYDIGATVKASSLMYVEKMVIDAGK